MPKRGSVNPNLSPANREVLEGITALWAERGIPPTIRDIRDEIGASSTSLVYHHIRRLENLGFIERDPGVARSIRIVRRPANRQTERPHHAP